MRPSCKHMAIVEGEIKPHHPGTFGNEGMYREILQDSKVDQES